jgi:hypothetical protein
MVVNWWVLVHSRTEALAEGNSSREVFPFAKKTKKSCIHHSGGVVAREEKQSQRDRQEAGRRENRGVDYLLSSC